MRKLLKAIYCAPGKGDRSCLVAAHDAVANTVDLVDPDGKIEIKAVPLLADSVAACSLRGVAYARPQIWEKPAAASPAAEKKTGRKSDPVA